MGRRLVTRVKNQNLKGSFGKPGQWLVGAWDCNKGRRIVQRKNKQADALPNSASVR